jgi:hypothetical protein
MLYGIIVTCNKGCEHLISADEDYLKAWENAPLKYAGLDDATTILLDDDDPAVLELKKMEH